jgi:hypothetical protein
MKYKKFSQELFDQYDTKAREVVKTYFSKTDWKVVDNPDKYGPDLIATKDTYFIEVEIKNAWQNTTFPFTSIQLPQRKQKFTKLQYETTFLVLSKDLTQFIGVWGKELTEDRLVEVKNKFIPNGEYFFQVPLANTKLIKI